MILRMHVPCQTDNCPNQKQLIPLAITDDLMRYSGLVLRAYVGKCPLCEKTFRLYRSNIEVLP